MNHERQYYITLQTNYNYFLLLVNSYDKIISLFTYYK